MQELHAGHQIPLIEPRPDADALEPAGDLLGGAASGEQFQHLDFPGGDAEGGDRQGVRGEDLRPRGLPEDPGADPDTQPQEGRPDQGHIDLAGMDPRPGQVLQPLQGDRRKGQRHAIDQHGPQHGRRLSAVN